MAPYGGKASRALHKAVPPSYRAPQHKNRHTAPARHRRAGKAIKLWAAAYSTRQHHKQGSKEPRAYSDLVTSRALTNLVHPAVKVTSLVTINTGSKKSTTKA